MDEDCKADGRGQRRLAIWLRRSADAGLSETGPGSGLTGRGFGPHVSESPQILLPVARVEEACQIVPQSAQHLGRDDGGSGKSVPDDDHVMQRLDLISHRGLARLEESCAHPAPAGLRHRSRRGRRDRDGAYEKPRWMSSNPRRPSGPQEPLTRGTRAEYSCRYSVASAPADGRRADRVRLSRRPVEISK